MNTILLLDGVGVPLASCVNFYVGLVCYSNIFIGKLVVAPRAAFAIEIGIFFGLY